MPYVLTILQASAFGIEADLVRVSVGLEDIPDLCSRVQRALAAAKAAGEDVP